MLNAMRETYTSYQTLDKFERLRTPRVRAYGLAHEIDGLPCCEIVRILCTLRLVILNMRLQSEKAFPLGLFMGVGMLAEEYLHYQPYGIGQDFGVELCKNFAFVFVITFP